MFEAKCSLFHEHFQSHQQREPKIKFDFNTNIHIFRRKKLGVFRQSSQVSDKTRQMTTNVKDMDFCLFTLTPGLFKHYDSSLKQAWFKICEKIIQ